MENPFLGVVFHWLGGLASGSFYVPYKGVKKWSWETYWLAGGFFSWLIAPWIAAFFLSSNLIEVLWQTDSQTFWMTYLMGAFWGMGGLTFGLTMRYLGMSLGMAVALGYCAAFGTLIPPLIKLDEIPKLFSANSGVTLGSLIDLDGFHAKLLASDGGKLVLVGVVICLVGILFGGFAGVRKEKELTKGSESTIKEFNFTKGLLIATFSGIMSACFSFGFHFGTPITVLSAAQGTGPLWVGLPVIVVILLGGLTTNLIWCVILHLKNGSAHQYFSPTVKPLAGQTAGGGEIGHAPSAAGIDAPVGSPVSLSRNWFFCALAGVTWYMQFFFYQMGESQMGSYKFSSWTLHMASIIIFSTLWGIYFSEWKGASPMTKRFVGLMLAALVGSTIIIGYGNYVSAGGAGGH